MRLATLAALCALSLSVAAAENSSTTSSTSSKPWPPNFFLMLTDDQDLILRSMVGARRRLLALPCHAAPPQPPLTPPRWQTGMPFTTSLVQNGSVANLSNFFAHVPVCCPSRSSLLSGRYFRSFRASSPDDGSKQDICMHGNTSSYFEGHTFFKALWEAGYATGMWGKVKKATLVPVLVLLVLLLVRVLVLTLLL